MTLKNFNLSLPTRSPIDDLNNRLLREELNYDVEKLKTETNFLIQNLNDEQLYIYNEILKQSTFNTIIILYLWSWRNRENISLEYNYNQN